jgi:hypothetical protein
MTAGANALGVGEKLSATGCLAAFLGARRTRTCLRSPRGRFRAVHRHHDLRPARQSQNAVAYMLWVFVGIALVLMPYAFLREGAGVFKPMPVVGAAA